MPSSIVAKFDGVDGECQVEGYTGWVELNSVSMGMHNPITISSGTGGSGGTPTISDLNFTVVPGKHSPELVKKCLMGKHFETVIIDYLKTTGDAKPEWFHKITLTKVFVSSASDAMSGNGDGNGFENYSLNSVKVKKEYKVQGNDGLLTAAGSVEYDQQLAKTT